MCSPYPCVNDVVSPGTTITLRVSYHLPITTFRDLALTIHLQAPLFDATQLALWGNISSGEPPSVGSAHWGAGDSTGLVPVITTDSVTNYVVVSYGTHVDHSLPSTQIDFLMTFTITDAVYKV